MAALHIGAQLPFGAQLSPGAEVQHSPQALRQIGNVAAGDVHGGINGRIFIVGDVSVGSYAQAEESIGLHVLGFGQELPGILLHNGCQGAGIYSGASLHIAVVFILAEEPFGSEGDIGQLSFEMVQIQVEMLAVLAEAQSGIQLGRHLKAAQGRREIQAVPVQEEVQEIGLGIVQHQAVHRDGQGIGRQTPAQPEAVQLKVTLAYLGRKYILLDAYLPAQGKLVETDPGVHRIGLGSINYPGPVPYADIAQRYPGQAGRFLGTGILRFIRLGNYVQVGMDSIVGVIIHPGMVQMKTGHAYAPAENLPEIHRGIEPVGGHEGILDRTAPFCKQRPADSKPVIAGEESVGIGERQGVDLRHEIWEGLEVEPGVAQLSVGERRFRYIVYLLAHPAAVQHQMQRNNDYC